MKITKDDIVYCDANFLIAYGASEVKQPELKKRAYILFAKLRIHKCKIVASTLRRYFGLFPQQNLAGFPGQSRGF